MQIFMDNTREFILRKFLSYIYMDERLMEIYSLMLQSLTSKGANYLPLVTPSDPDSLITELFNVNQYVNNWARNKPKHIDRIPIDGHWYMVTITQPATETEFDIMSKHDLAMNYFNRNKIEVYLAGLEQAGAWHVHYAICSKEHLKNTKRDLTKLLKVKVVDIGKKVKTLRDFNGLCNYVLKRGYEDDNTHKKDLVNKLEYKDGFGWVLKTT